MIDEIIQETIRYNEIWHTRFHFFSIKDNEVNKQWIPCKFGNIMLDLLMRSLNCDELEFSKIKVFEYFGKAKQ